MWKLKTNNDGSLICTTDLKDNTGPNKQNQSLHKTMGLCLVIIRGVFKAQANTYDAAL